MPPPVAPLPSLRPAQAADIAFLAELYRLNRWTEVAAAGWPEHPARAFLAQQFDAQTRDWARHFPAATRSIILLAGRPVGRLVVHRDTAARRLHVIDIALLPAHHCRGHGSRLLATLLAEADAHGWTTTLHVLAANPACRLYLRLGFAPTGRLGDRLALARPPAAGPSAIPFLRHDDDCAPPDFRDGFGPRSRREIDLTLRSGRPPEPLNPHPYGRQLHRRDPIVRV